MPLDLLFMWLFVCFIFGGIGFCLGYQLASDKLASKRYVIEHDSKGYTVGSYWRIDR